MTTKDKITEQPSHYDHLEQMSVCELLQHIDRGTRMLQDSLGLSYDEARERLLESGSVSDCL